MSTIGEDEKIFPDCPSICEGDSCGLRIDFGDFRGQLDRCLDKIS